MKDGAVVGVELSKTLQRYKNKSKSQLINECRDNPDSCLRPCKDTKIKANHNIAKSILENELVV